MSWYHRITNGTIRNYWKCNTTKIGKKYGCKTNNIYDWMSISHYPEKIPNTNFRVIRMKNSACKNGKKCTLGQRINLSKLDVSDITKLYNCGE